MANKEQFGGLRLDGDIEKTPEHTEIYSPESDGNNLEKGQEILVTRLEIIFKKPVVGQSERVGDTDRWGKTHVHMNESSTEFGSNIVDVPSNEMEKTIKFYKEESPDHENVEEVNSLYQIAYEILGTEEELGEGTYLKETIDGKVYGVKELRKIPIEKNN